MEWIFSREGMIEILPVVFAVVSEYLRRERAKVDRNPQPQEENELRKYEGVSDWILNNYNDLIDAFQEVTFLNPLESTKYLLTSVFEVTKIFQEHGVRINIIM